MYKSKHMRCMIGYRHKPLHERQEGGIETIGDLDFVGVLPEENDALVDEFANDEPEDLSEVTTRDEFLSNNGDKYDKIIRNTMTHLERLFARFIRLLINSDVILCSGEMLVLK